MSAPRLNPALGIPILRDDKHDLHDLGVGTYRGPRATRRTDWAYVGELVLNATLGLLGTAVAVLLAALAMWGTP